MRIGVGEVDEEFVGVGENRPRRGKRGKRRHRHHVLRVVSDI